jgi:hypothetical protein
MTTVTQPKIESKPADKAAKFKTIAERRMSNLLRTLKHIGNLSNRSSYDYSSEQISKMLRTIRNEVDAIEAKFKRVDLKSPQGFSFD